jgi:hypothetical protein
MSQFPGLCRQGPSTLAHNTSNQHVIFWWSHEGTFLLDQGRYDLSTKPARASLRCNHECLAPCWMLLLGKTPCWGLTKIRLPCAAHPVCLFLSSRGTLVSNQQLLANFGFMAIPALEVLLLPPCRPRLSPGFIWVHFMLHWKRPDWFWYLTIFHLFPPVKYHFCWRQWPKNGDFMWLMVFQYHLVGMTWKHT